MDQRGIAKADVQRGGAGDAFQRALQRGEAVFARGIGAGLHVGLVQLHHVGTGCVQVLDLLVHCGGIGHRQGGGIAIVIVLRLLAHGERTGHGDLGHPVGVPLHELDIAHLHRVLAADVADHARHRHRFPRTIQRGAVVVHVDAVQRRGEAVGIAFAPHLAVGDDVEPGFFLLLDGDDGGIVPRLLQQFGLHLPQFHGARARREASRQLGAVDQPVGLRVGAYQARRKEHQLTVSRWSGRTSLLGVWSPASQRFSSEWASFSRIELIWSAWGASQVNSTIIPSGSTT